jgi:hypothetical protein
MIPCTGSLFRRLWVVPDLYWCWLVSIIIRRALILIWGRGVQVRIIRGRILFTDILVCVRFYARIYGIARVIQLIFNRVKKQVIVYGAVCIGGTGSPQRAVRPGILRG